MRSVGRSTILALWAAIALLFVGGVVGVGAVEDTPDGGAAASTEVELPDGPATTQLRWVLDRLGKGAPEPQLREHFAPSFLASVRAQQLAAILVQLGADGPFTIESADPKGPHSLSIVLAGTKERMTVDIEVEPGPPHRITGLLFQPAGFLEPDESFDAHRLLVSRE